MMVQEFTNAAELTAHYKAVFARRAARDKTALIPIVVMPIPKATEPKPFVRKEPLIPKEAALKIDVILKATGTAFNIDKIDLLSKTQSYLISHPRQVAMWYAKTHTDLTLTQIGNRFGGKDHATVRYAFTKVENNKHEFQPMIDRLQDQVNLLTSEAMP